MAALLTCESRVNDNLCDIRLLYSDIDKKRYACGECGKLAADPKGLHCDEKQHEQIAILYCNKCALLKEKENKCPVNGHDNPIFCDEKLLKAQINKNVQFMCPYSMIIENNNENNNIPAAFVQDTMEGNRKKQCDSCNWKGTYIELQQHVKICKYKPKEEIINKTLNEFNNKIEELQHEMNIFYKKDKQIEELQGDNDKLANKIKTLQHEQKENMDKLNRENVKLENKINALQQNSKLSMIVGIICFVILGIIGQTVYNDHNNNIISLQETRNDDASNIIYNDVKTGEQFQEILQNIKIRMSEMTKYIDNINMSMKQCNDTIKLYNEYMSDLEIKIKDVKTYWTEEINELKAEIINIRSWIDNVGLNVKTKINGTVKKLDINDTIDQIQNEFASKSHPTKGSELAEKRILHDTDDVDELDVNDNDENIDGMRDKKQMRIIAWLKYMCSLIFRCIKPLIYYGIKLFGQLVNLFCCSFLVDANKKDFDQNALYIIGIIAGHLGVKIFYFYPTNWVDWTVMIMIMVMQCGGALIFGSRLNSSKQDKIGNHGVGVLIELTVLYWTIWCNDDKILMMLGCMFAMVIINGNLKGNDAACGGTTDAIHPVVAILISALYVIFDYIS